jgi:hypothetical protein
MPVCTPSLSQGTGYLRTEYGIDAIATATQGLPINKEAKRRRVIFFETPFRVDELLNAVRACLECPVSGAS